MAAEEVTLNLLVGALTVVSLVLSWMAIRAWRYARGGRQLALSLAFVLLLAKSVFLWIGLFRAEDFGSLIVGSLAFDLGALLAFYFASLR